jgi:hypothetical protein
MYSTVSLFVGTIDQSHITVPLSNMMMCSHFVCDLPDLYDHDHWFFIFLIQFFYFLILLFLGRILTFSMTNFL